MLEQGKLPLYASSQITLLVRLNESGSSRARCLRIERGQTSGRKSERRKGEQHESATVKSVDDLRLPRVRYEQADRPKKE
jgi:hypothetical protein